MTYKEFLESKKHLLGNFGFEPNYIPDVAFDFQKEIIRRAVVKGRIAIFADTGLGKTLIQLSIAKNIVNHTNQRVLIITPLAVGFQFISEAKNLKITDDIEQTLDGKFSKKIVVCNYERLHLLKSEDFIGVILDESSILKNFDGKIKNQITAFIKKVKYRFLSTATPSPNDFIELGTSSEVLGYMGYMDMLGRFFSNNQNSVDSSSMKRVGSKYYLKPHAEKDFFTWVNQWSIMVRMPSDLGFSDDRFILPELTTNHHLVKNQSLIDVNGQILMFTPIAKSFYEVRHEQKQTIKERCIKAADLTKDKTSVYWVNFNEESDTLEKIDPGAVAVYGSMRLEKKEEILIAFASGEIKRLITKAKITGMGLNWQHCSHTVFFPTWSYEQYYQAVRRFWRFGQKNPVTCELVISDGQTRVLESLTEKRKKAQDLYENLLINNQIKEITENVNLLKITKPYFL